MSEIREFKEPKLYAKEKLEEARYFLLQMRRNYVVRKEFIFNMNAFLNSTRSVRWVLEKEFAHNPPLGAWYSQKESEMDKDEFMKFFKNLRNVSTHEGTPEHKVSLKWAYVIPVNEKLDAFGYSERKVSGNEKDMSSMIVVPIYDKNGMRGKPKLIPPTYSLATLWEFEKAPKGYATKDILGLSTKYYEKLKQLVEEAERELRKAVFSKKE